MTRPLNLPEWATDANFTATEITDPHHGTPTKVEPSAGQKANGFEPRYRVPAQIVNWVLANLTQWASYLALVPLANWTKRAHATDGTPTSAIAIAARPWTGELDAFMAIFGTAGNGRAQRSTDGATWIDLSTSITGALYDVVYMGGSVNLWLIAGATGTIWSHPPNTGGAWTARGPGTGDHFRAIAVNDDATLAVAVGENGRIYTSTNGTAWTSRTSGTGEDLLDVAYGGGRWVAVGTAAGADDFILTSTNGTTWTSLAIGPTSTASHVVYDAATDKFVLFVGASVRQVDAATGTLSGVIGTVGGVPSSVATDGAGTIVVVSAVTIYTSTDAGETWSSGSLLLQGDGVLTDFTGLAYSTTLGCYLAAGEDGAAAEPILAQSLRTS